MTSEPVRAGADWLALREPADAAARAGELVDELSQLLPDGGPLRVHDLGCGTGAMPRWLAPRLTGTQHWVLHDRDIDLLDRVGSHPSPRAADGARVQLTTRPGDITRLGPADLRGADLLTASALLDMLDAEELDRFVRSCARAGCPVLVTLSVVGRVALDPAAPLDVELTEAFNAHQRRTTGGRQLLGPEAAAVAVERFSELGREVTVRSSPWQLGAGHAVLATAWLTGWVGAATEQRPELMEPARGYLRDRLRQATTGALSVMVDHQDMLVR